MSVISKRSVRRLFKTAGAHQVSAVTVDALRDHLVEYAQSIVNAAVRQVRYEEYRRIGLRTLQSACLLEQCKRAWEYQFNVLEIPDARRYVDIDTLIVPLADSKLERFLKLSQEQRDKLANYMK
jgi:hypothetical protein